MDDDLSTLDGAFSPISVDSSLGALDSGFDATGNSDDSGDLGAASSTPTTAQVATTPAPSSNSGASATASVSGFQNVLNTLTGVFTSGVAAYNTVATNTGLPLANGTRTTPTTAQVVAATPIWGGLTLPQLQLIGGGVALIAVLFIFARRR